MDTSGTHTCPGGCGRQVPNAKLFCFYHWSLVPPTIQAEVYRTYDARRRNPRDPAAVGAHVRAMAAATRAIRERTQGAES